MNLAYYIVLLGRLLLACILGGIIGFEREHTNRPAGFRTHILVCVGSALVMVTSEFIFNKYAGHANLDPARLGAQVISGIGFLGAGTIIRQGFNVKGLTTAASLWAVSCVGIAAGIGFYEGAIATTALIFVTLIVLKRFERYTLEKKQCGIIYVKSHNISGQIDAINKVFDNNKLQVKSIEFIDNDNGGNLILKVLVRYPKGADRAGIIRELHRLEGIQDVYEG